MEKIHIGILGMTAGFLTTMSFIPQVLKILRTKHTKDISLGMYTILLVGVALWLVYGIYLEEFPLILFNIITLILCSFVLFMKLKYK